MTMGPMGVPKWRRPLAEEPAHGLLLHLVELNGYSSVKTVAECLGVRMSDLRSGRQTALTTFARAIRCPQTLLVCDRPSNCRKMPGPNVPMGTPEHATPLRCRYVAFPSAPISSTGRSGNLSGLPRRIQTPPLLVGLSLRSPSAPVTSCAWSIDADAEARPA